MEEDTKFIEFKGKQIVITSEPNVNIKVALESTQFADWLDEVKNDGMLDLRSVHFQSVDMFGP